LNQTLKDVITLTKYLKWLEAF